MNRHYYAIHNTHADRNRGDAGFANTWEVSRFPNRAARDAFVDYRWNQRARAVTRRQAERVYRDSYTVVGAAVPFGGLFGQRQFWNEWETMQ